jgi:hypothetical protein
VSFGFCVLREGLFSHAKLKTQNPKPKTQNPILDCARGMRLFKRTFVDMNETAVCDDLWTAAARPVRAGTASHHVSDRIS